MRWSFTVCAPGLLGLGLVLSIAVGGRGEAAEGSSVTVSVGAVHAWRPPFGVERVGRGVAVAVRAKKVEAGERYEVVGLVEGTERERRELQFIVEGGETAGRVELENRPERVVVYRLAGAQRVEVSRAEVEWGAIEADAEARAEKMVNPVDVGLIMPPVGWVVLEKGQRTIVDVAAVAGREDFSGARLRIWFESSPRKVHQEELELPRRGRVTRRVEVGPPRFSGKRDTLRVAIVDGRGGELWGKAIPVMLVEERPEHPAFGATELKLRYDLPITINHGEAGKLGELSTLDYEKGWDAGLKDVVVWLPGGGRFVFWRGSSYVPFWAGKKGTGMSYEWAEWGPPPDGFVDSVEPLMDKELRYGRVRIVESTASRVWVRWTYQSCDFNYKVWGDSAVEDYVFYPDGFGTRTMTLTHGPGVEYELSEFIVLSPAGAHPLRFLPRNAVDFVYLDGRKAEMLFPPGGAGAYDAARQRRESAVVYRVRTHRDDPSAAIYFYPSNDHYPAVQFAAFFDRGEMVTPAYWGSHWPLSRGK